MTDHTRATRTRRGVALALVTLLLALGSQATPDEGLRLALALGAALSQVSSILSLIASRRR